MTLMERRRALMGQNDILYQLFDYVFSEAGYVDTGLALLLTDSDFSIAMDCTTTKNPSSGNASTFNFVEIGSALLRFGKYASATLMLVWSGNANPQSFNTNNAANAGRHRFVLTRPAGEGPSIAYRKNEYSVIKKGPINNPMTYNYKSKLTIGGSTSNGRYLPSGTTVHSVTVYNRVLTTDEINDFLEVS